MKYKKKYRPANAQTHRKRKYFALKFSSIVAIIFPAKVDLRRPVRPSPPTWFDGRRRAAKDRTAGYESQIKSGQNFTITVSRAGNRASATAMSVSITEMSCVFFHSYPPLDRIPAVCPGRVCVWGELDHSERYRVGATHGIWSIHHTRKRSFADSRARRKAAKVNFRSISLLPSA